MCSRHNFVFIFFCSLSLLVECCWFKFLNIYFSGHFGFTSLIFFVSSFDLLFFQNFFSFILLLPLVPTSLFSSFISLLFCLQLNIYIFFLFFFCSASRYFVILVSLVFAFRLRFLCWDVCYSGRFVWVRFLFIFSFSCSVVLFLKKNVKHSSKIRPSTKKRETFTKLTPKWGPPYRGPKNVKKWRF